MQVRDTADLLYKQLLPQLCRQLEPYDCGRGEKAKEGAAFDAVSQFVDRHLDYIRQVHGAEWENYVDLTARLNLSDDIGLNTLLGQLPPYLAIGDRFHPVFEQNCPPATSKMALVLGYTNQRDFEQRFWSDQAPNSPSARLWSLLGGRRNWWFRTLEVRFYERDPNVWKSRADVLLEGHSAQEFSAWIRDKELNGYVLTRSHGLCELGASHLLRDNFSFEGVLFRVEDLDRITQAIRKNYDSEMHVVAKKVIKYGLQIKKANPNIGITELMRQVCKRHKGHLNRPNGKPYSPSSIKLFLRPLFHSSD